VNSRLVGFYQANGFLFTPVQVGGGSFHPSTLISATQMAASVAEEVDRKLMSKLKDEEALGDTRERIGFL